GEPVQSADIASDPLWTASRACVVMSYGVRACWATPLRGADGRLVGALACFCDTARPATPRELELASTVVHLASIALSSARDAASIRSSEASFRSFVENAPAAIFRETLHGHLVSTNAAMLALLRYPDGESLARAASAGQLYADDAARRRLVAALEADDLARGLEVDWCRADGTRVTVRLSARAYRDERTRVWLWEGYAEDVTPLRQAESALRRNEKLAAVGQLVSGVAHELNNPLSSILHFAEDLLDDRRTQGDAEALGMIRDQARRSRSIVRDLLSFVQQRDVVAEAVSLAGTVAATVRAMMPSAEMLGVRVHLETAQESVVHLDRAALEQVITNLLSNAIQAAGMGGEVWVRTACGPGCCRIVVEDSGPGISPEVLPRIFDPFFTTKPTGEGTGLGLSVSLGIVEQFGGRIATEPRGGNLPGSRFVVTLPLTGGPADTAIAPAVAATPARPVMEPGSCRVLLIDDEPSIRSALRRFFTRRGWQVEEAGDGAAGLALLSRDAGRFALVVSDLRMPGLSGVDLHDRLVADRSQVLPRMIFSTGDVASHEAASFVQRTSCPVLQKPFELAELDDLITLLTERGVLQG
ncbi:MAG: sensor protein, partial [Gemmatimonadetes bacterium]|nr:sensor protein [Gemmatimonadota bacterium]